MSEQNYYCRNLLAPVSVIIPCYRSWNTIERAVASVANQTWRPAEMIIVDDASEDKTPVVIKSIQNQYGEDWVKIILLKKNSGPGAARNYGWDAATQPYIAFLDADDTWHPCKIDVQLRYMLSHPDVVITGHRSRCIRNNERIETHFSLQKGSFNKANRWKLLISNYFSTRSVMLSNDLEFRFEPTKRYSEDYLLWLRIICKKYEAAFANIDLAYFYGEPYKAGGLSSQLWEMEKGELDTYRNLYHDALISWPLLVGLSLLSLTKYLRRILTSRLSKE